MIIKEGSTKIVNFMTLRAGVLVLEHGHTSHIVKMHYFFKNLLLYSQAMTRKTDSIVIMPKERSTKIVNFMITRAGILVLESGQISHIVKMHQFFKNLLLFTQAQIRQTESIVMMTKKESTKIVNFMTPGAGVLVLGHGRIVNMQYFLSSSCLHQGMDQTN